MGLNNLEDHFPPLRVQRYNENHFCKSSRRIFFARYCLPLSGGKAGRKCQAANAACLEHTAAVKALNALLLPPCSAPFYILRFSV